jgi:hypothetical protein
MYVSISDVAPKAAEANRLWFMKRINQKDWNEGAASIDWVYRGGLMLEHMYVRIYERGRPEHPSCIGLDCLRLMRCLGVGGTIVVLRTGSPSTWRRVPVVRK